ncbi:hypothetical protein QT979_01065 [Microcoleus sp. w2-18bC1]|uniref:hypothetical protein n=1 Tax=Microcoleus sp. w2-18aC6 TaxID=2818997 RepID=UPI002FD13146
MPPPMSAIARIAKSKACQFGTEILSQPETEKSKSQHRPHKINAAAAKKAIARNDIGCNDAIHPRREEAAHPATK